MKDEQAKTGVTPSPSLEAVREKINVVDQEILKLIASRRELSQEAISFKDKSASEIRDPRREQELLLDRVRWGRDKGLDSQLVGSVFHEVLRDSIRIQQDFLQAKLNGNSTKTNVRIGYHGIDGSYSHLAAQSFFAGRAPQSRGAKAMFSGYDSFKNLVVAVENGEIDRAILPVENTATGLINEIYDLLLHSRVHIVGEERFRIVYSLLANGDVGQQQLQVVYCSPLAMTECANFLRTLNGCRVEYCADSAIAVKRARDSENRFAAAIASEEAGELFGMTTIATKLGNQDESFTRYLVIAQAPQKVDQRVPARTSIAFTLVQRPGSLADALNVFKAHKINLSKIVSQAILSDPSEEMMYVDFFGNVDHPEVGDAMRDLTKQIRFIKVLGCYPASAPAVAVDIKPEVIAATTDARTIISVSEPVPEPKVEKKGDSSKGYKLASREYKSDNTIIRVGNVEIGNGEFLVMAGPCSVESRDQIMACAEEAHRNGAKILRGGVFKPRTSPYSFQGLGYEGLDLLVEAGKKYGLPVITEVMTTEDVARVAEKADIIQIGARNMQNYSLLKAVGEIRRPIMLKRGMSSSLDELLQAVEYILAGGNQQVFLCERGIRTFETSTRSTLDISAVPVLKQKTHLPVFIDPSHAAGVRELVPPLAKAAKAVGADGIIVEFHPEPEKALSDGPQALRFPQFAQMMADLRGM